MIAEESQRFRKPYWQFPTYIASSDPLGRSQEEILRIAGVTMPDAATQDRLLSAYFQWCHPLLPIIYRPTFSRTNASQAPPFLLNAMFALAARYCESETPMVFARHWSVVDCADATDCSGRLATSTLRPRAPSWRRTTTAPRVSPQSRVYCS